MISSLTSAGELAGVFFATRAFALVTVSRGVDDRLSSACLQSFYQVSSCVVDDGPRFYGRELGGCKGFFGGGPCCGV